MTTLPIEVIVQDAEAPVVLGEDGTNNTEINITVPDTGTIGSSGDISSSTSSIILPAILLVLAIGSIVAILIHKYHKQKKDKTSKKEKLAATASGTIAILAATVLVGNLVIPATNAATNVEPGTAELDTVDKITITATRTADSDEVVATVKNTFYATANLDFGYKVTASMAEGLDSANLYLDGDETSEYYIAPAEDGVLANNAWGYTLEEPSEDTTYLSILLEDTPVTIVKGTSEIEDEAVDIYYTIKVDKSLPVGTYTGELEYALTDNNFPSTLTTMQGMTTEICENTFTPGNQVTDPVPAATLEDIRDHNTYTIAKLADGKCWMTQNLDLDLSTEVTLTPADTDVSANWTPDNSTIHFTGTSVSGWSNSDTAPRSADPGDIYYYTSGTDENDTPYDSLAECEAEHSDGTCQHYHAGNYYNWPATVASNDTSGMTEQYYDAPDSICPAGWRLPTGGDAAGGYEDGELFALLNSHYELLGDIYSEQGARYYGYKDEGFNTIRISPLWLSRAGFVWYGTSNSVASTGSYNVSTVSTRDNTYSVEFMGNNRFKVPGGSPTSMGSSIRCIAQ